MPTKPTKKAGARPDPRVDKIGSKVDSSRSDSAKVDATKPHSKKGAPAPKAVASKASTSTAERNPEKSTATAVAPSPQGSKGGAPSEAKEKKAPPKSSTPSSAPAKTGSSAPVKSPAAAAGAKTSVPATGKTAAAPPKGRDSKGKGAGTPEAAPVEKSDTAPADADEDDGAADAAPAARVKKGKAPAADSDGDEVSAAKRKKKKKKKIRRFLLEREAGPPRVRIGVGPVSLDAYLNTSTTARAVLHALPLEGRAQIQGEEISVPVELDLPSENPRDFVDPGVIGYSPSQRSIHIFFGQRPTSPVNVIGIVLGDPGQLRQVLPNDFLRLELPMIEDEHED